MELRAVLMAGGSGTRLRPLTCDLPKPMVPVLNRPIAEHIINLLKKHGIEEIVLAMHYLPGAIQQYFGNGSDWGVLLHPSIEEEQPLGTAGCIKYSEELLDRTFLVISGDSITNFDLKAAIAFHQEKKSQVTLVLTSVSNPVDFGVVITDDQGRVRKFIEKPTPGEVFSDTVNTGTYIFEPGILDEIPPGQEFDISQDLLPKLLAKGVPIYGYVAAGYWCDVGQLDAYRQVQHDVLKYMPELIESPQLRPGLWVGEDTFIHSSCTIETPVVIGNNCRIGARVNITADTVIGDNVTIGSDADLKRPVIWNGAVIGEGSQLRACIIGRGVRIGRGAQILEGAVIGSGTKVGEDAQVNSNVRVWPDKEIEPLATLTLNLIWGDVARHNLFSQRGVQGLANIDITPEFAVKLGTAYGSTLKTGAQVTVSRDQRSVSRMVARSLIAGLMSVGVHVQDLEATAIPVARLIIPTLSVAGGLHIRIHPDRPGYLLIEFFDGRGINIAKPQERKIESAYFKEDLRRASIEEIGKISHSQGVDLYNSAFQQHLNLASIRSSGRVVIDYAYAVSGAVLPLLLSKFGVDAVVLNASLNQTSPNGPEREALLVQLGRVVAAVQATFGVQVSAHGEQLTLVDERGEIIRGETMTALMVHLMLKAHPGSTVVVPVQASSAVEALARRHGGKVKRTKSNPTDLMEACQKLPHVVLGGSGEMGFIFPELHAGFDAMFCVAKLIEMLAKENVSLSEIRQQLPPIVQAAESIPCPWGAKGGLMRHILENHQGENIDLQDGVKIYSSRNDNWLLILPDAGEPVVHIHANSDDAEWVKTTMAFYRHQVQDYVTEYQASIAGVPW
jgi:mannose-1-phosphate guanylyltransferase / phosphomannomutase